MSPTPTSKATSGQATSGQATSGPFTDAEIKFIEAVLGNLTGDVSFDASAVAAQVGYKDGIVARVRWNQIRRKHSSAAAAGAKPEGVKKRTRKKAAAPKKVAAGADEATGGGSGDETGTPTKGAAKAGGKAKAEEPVVRGEAEKVGGDVDRVNGKDGEGEKGSD